MSLYGNMEIWKDVIGYEKYFMISNEGRLLSKRTNKILKQHINKNGYCGVTTKIGGRNGIDKYFRIHRLVAEAFIPNHLNKPVVNHKDGNKTNNHLYNLEWTTNSENTQHAVDTGLIVRPNGSEQSNSKLTEQQAEEIRIRRANGEKCRALAIEYSVHHTQISRIARGVAYKK